MSRPTVSCILTAYNYARYLPEAIDSVLAQDYPAEAIELIVVDDGSTDETPEVIASYGDRVHGIRRPNGGLNAATQTGIEAATGDLLTFIDADDAWRPDRLGLLVDALEAHPEAALAWGDMEVVDSVGELIAPSFRAASGIAPLTGRVHGRLLPGNSVSAGSMMVRASFRHCYSPIPEVAPYQDWWIVTQVSRTAEIVCIPEPVNRYRHHGGNMNLGHSPERRVALLGDEVAFRRHLLREVGTLATVEELVNAVGGLDQVVRFVADGKRTTPQRLLATDDAARARAVAAMESASGAIDDGDLLKAMGGLVAAVGEDPLYAQPRDLLAMLAPHARELERRGPALAATA